MYLYFVFALAGFLLGSVLFSYHLPKLFCGRDIVLLSKDHNPGTANAIKYGSVPVGILCLVCDLAKGFIPCFAAKYFVDYASPLFALIIIAPVLGHAFTPFYHFSGGKAIACSFGAMLALMPQSLAVWVLVFWYLFFSLAVKIYPHEKRSIFAFSAFLLCCVLGFIFYSHNLSFLLGCAGISIISGYKNLKDYKRRYSNNFWAAMPTDPGSDEELVQKL